MSGRFGQLASDAVSIEAEKKKLQDAQADLRYARKNAARYPHTRSEWDSLKVAEEKMRAAQEKFDQAVRAKDSKLATDPPVSEAQRRAMFAAKAGRSTLGIPKSVGEKFVGKAHDAIYERDLKDDEPRIVEGIKGINGRLFQKKFKNHDEMERWMDREGDSGDYEIQRIKRA
jgi:hypothetical protein